MNCKESFDESNSEKEIADEFSVSLNLAKKVSAGFQSDKLEQTKSNKSAKVSSNDPNKEKQIDKVETRKTKDGKTSMYLIKYKSNADESFGGGYTILSADLRAEPILAYSETDELDLSNPGLEAVLDNFEQQIIYARNNLNKASNRIKSLWDKYEKAKNGRYSAIQECQPWYPNYPNCCPTDYYSEYIFGLTNWRQGTPYNSECPLRSCGTGSPARANAGCGAIAVSQVLNYYTIPGVKTLFNITGINKPNIGITYPFDNSTAIVADRSKLINTVGDFMNSFQVSNCNTATWRHNIVNGFFTSGYSNPGNRVSYSTSQYGNVRMELKQRRPVIMDGTTAGFFQIDAGTFENWHIWMLDGYKEYQWSTVDNGQCYTYLNYFFHHNWGWGQAGTWCAAESIIDEDNITYDRYLNVITNIRP